MVRIPVIYFCIPVHDEEKTVGVVLWKVRQVMAAFPRDYQILLADDGSTDGTAQAVEPYRRVLPLIHMRVERSRGYAASLEMLLRDAVRRSRYPRRDIVVIMQADFSDDAEDAPALLRRMESGADLVVGGPVSVAVRAGLAERLAAGISRRLLQRKEWPEPVTDPLHGFTAVRLSCIRAALEGHETERLLKWEGMAANAALLAAVAPHARRIEAIEMTKHPERRQRPARARLIPALREVHRFVRGQPSPGVARLEMLVPDEVHGDLAALRQERSAPKAAPRRRQPRKEGEQQGDSPRKDVKPRRRPPAAKPVTGEAGAEKPKTRSRPVRGAGVAGEAGMPGDAGAEGPSRRRGSRGGNRSRRKRPKSTEKAAADSGSLAGASAADASVSEVGGPGTESGASGEARPKKRRRRGSRGGSARRRAGAAQSGDTPSEGSDGSQRDSGETDGV